MGFGGGNGMDIERESTLMMNFGEEISAATPAGNGTYNLSITNPVRTLNHGTTTKST